ncbi:MAG: DNA repair exonuclease [Nitrososphaerota archaeon]
MKENSFKLIHTADLHLGATATLKINGPNIDEIRRRDFYNNFAKIVDEALKENVDLFLICGDVFHKSDPSPKDFVEFSEQIGRLTEAGIKIIIIAGNHDRPRVKGGQNPIRGLVEAKHPSLYYIQSTINEPIIIKGKKASVGIVPIPYIDPRVVKYINEDYEKILKEKINNILENPKMNNVDYKILMAHLIVLGADYKKIFYWLKDEPEIKLSNLMEEKFDYIALGHVHTSQCISKKVYYPGSIEKVNFLEEDENKSFILARFNDREAEVELKSLLCRPMKTLDFTISSNLNPTETLIETIEKSNIENGTLLRLMVKADQTAWHNINISKIEQVLIQKIKVAGYEFNKKLIEYGKGLRNLHMEGKPLRDQILEFIQTINIDEKIKNRAKKFAEEIMNEVGLL